MTDIIEASAPDHVVASLTFSPAKLVMWAVVHAGLGVLFVRAAVFVAGAGQGPDGTTSIFGPQLTQWAWWAIALYFMVRALLLVARAIQGGMAAAITPAGIVYTGRWLGPQSLSWEEVDRVRLREFGEQMAPHRSISFSAKASMPVEGLAEAPGAIDNWIDLANRARELALGASAAPASPGLEALA